MASPRRSATPIAAWLLAALPLLQSCGDPVQPTAAVELVRLNIGDQTILVDRAEGPRSAVSLSGIEAHTLATFHRGDGTEVELDPVFYEVTLVPSEPSVMFYARSQAFQGRLIRLMSGETQVTFSIVNVLSGAVEFGPHNLTIN